MIEKIYFVYYHVRLDTNKVFYVGKGTDCTKNRICERAYDKDSRNIVWKRITSKTKWTYYIIKFFDKEIEALKYETRLINMFGALNDIGQLCNIKTDTVDILDEEQKRKKYPKRKTVYQYDLDGNFIAEYYGYSEVAKKFNISVSGLSKACNKHTLFYGFQWRFYKLEKIETKTIQAKKVYQYSLEGEFIKEWNSMREVEKILGLSTSAISNVARDVKTHTCGNFQWKLEKFDKIEPIKKWSNKVAYKHPIYQYDLNYNILNIFTSFTKASKSSGVCRKVIANMCNKKSSTSRNPYIWSYIPIKTTLNKLMNEYEV